MTAILAHLLLLLRIICWYLCSRKVHETGGKSDIWNWRQKQVPHRSKIRCTLLLIDIFVPSSAPCAPQFWDKVQINTSIKFNDSPNIKNDTHIAFYKKNSFPLRSHFLNEIQTDFKVGFCPKTWKMIPILSFLSCSFLCPLACPSPDASTLN